MCECLDAYLCCKVLWVVKRLEMRYIYAVPLHYYLVN